MVCLQTLLTDLIGAAHSGSASAASSTSSSQMLQMRASSRWTTNTRTTSRTPLWPGERGRAPAGSGR
eukprot:3168349-Alexandrium_andersonii.AAC.1